MGSHSSGLTFCYWQYPPNEQEDSFQDGDMLHTPWQAHQPWWHVHQQDHGLYHHASEDEDAARI